MDSVFEKTYHDFYPRLFRIATKMLFDSEDAKDVVHDVFIAYYLTLNNKINITDTKSWLIRCTINRSVDFKRKKSKAIRTDDLTHEISDISFENNSDKSDMLNLIQKLNTREQTLVVLYSEGYSYKEMAEITEVKFTSVGKTLERIIAKLKKQVK